MPELVACDAEHGAMMVSPAWLLMWMLVELEKEGRRIPPCVSSMPSFAVGGSFGGVAVACCLFRSLEDGLSSDVGALGELGFDVSGAAIGSRRRGEAASSAAPETEIADAFLRVLKANFLGGLKVWRMVCSFSERALIA